MRTKYGDEERFCEKFAEIVAICITLIIKYLKYCAILADVLIIREKCMLLCAFLSALTAVISYETVSIQIYFKM